MTIGRCPYCRGERELTICVDGRGVRYQVRCLDRSTCGVRWPKMARIALALQAAGGDLVALGP